MRVAVIGPGAMGTLFGGRLAAAGNDVTMVGTTQSTLDAINQGGIVIEDEAGTHVIPVRASRAEKLNDPVDLAILFTKTLYSHDALEAACGYIGEGTYVLTLQNGLGNVELISEFVDADRIIVGATNYASDLKGPGRVSSRGGGYVKIMSADGARSTMLDCVNEELLKAGFNASIAEDVREVIWEKVGFNAAVNALTAVCRVPCGGVGRVAEGRLLAERIARETAEVAHAYGVSASAERIIASLENTYEAHKGHFTSMAQDVLRQRRTEASFINGGIVAKAREKGMGVPYTEAVYDLLRVIEETYDLQG